MIIRNLLASVNIPAPSSSVFDVVTEDFMSKAVATGEAGASQGIVRGFRLYPTFGANNTVRITDLGGKSAAAFTDGTSFLYLETNKTYDIDLDDFNPGAKAVIALVPNFPARRVALSLLTETDLFNLTEGTIIVGIVTSVPGDPVLNRQISYAGTFTI